MQLCLLLLLLFFLPTYQPYFILVEVQQRSSNKFTPALYSLFKFVVQEVIQWFRK